MARSLRYLLLLLCTFSSLNVFAQDGPGSIEGNVKDEFEEGVMGAIIEVYSSGIKRGGTATDIDGNYSIKPLPAGDYEVIGTYAQYPRQRVTKVHVSPGRATTVNMNFKPSELDVVVIKWEKPLIQDDGKVTTSFSKEDIEKTPTRDLTKLVATAGGIVTSGRGNALFSAGSRSGNTIVMLDGIMIRGGVPNLPPGALDEIEVELGGMSARSGDATGAVVRMTTRGPSPIYTGSINVEKSVEGFGHNMGSFNLSGPLA